MDREKQTDIKYTRMVETAVPASSAAERTSVIGSEVDFVFGIAARRGDLQLYLAHNGKYRLRMMYCERKPIKAQGI